MKTSILKLCIWMIMAELVVSSDSSCQDINTDSCRIMMQSNPQMCTDATLATSVCPKLCGNCPLTCFSCSNIPSVDVTSCNRITCTQNQKCMIRSTHPTGPFTLGCEDQTTCTSSSTTTCCDNDLCNVPVLPTQPPTTQPPPTTTTVKTETTHTTNQHGQINLCSSRLQQLATHNGTATIGQFEESCYEVVEDSVSWGHASFNCRTNGGNLAAISNQAEQDFIFSILTTGNSHAVWIGLNDRVVEEDFQWISGGTVTYTHWLPGRKIFNHHSSEDCVYMRTDGYWDDTSCGGANTASEATGTRHAYICESATTNAVSPDGDVSKCFAKRPELIARADIFGQFGRSCYSLVKAKMTWYTALGFCRGTMYDLATITSSEEQQFIQGFLSRHSPTESVWIGLNDITTEGTFRWSTGTAMHYENWGYNHQSTHRYQTSNHYDCVNFKPYQHGQWIESRCDVDHAFLCELDIDGSDMTVLIGKK